MRRFFEGLVWRLDWRKTRGRILMHPMISGNINCRKNKDGLSADSRGLGRSGITKYGNATQVNRVVDVYDESSRFLCFERGRLALYGSIKGPVGLEHSLSSLHSLEHQLAFTQVLGQNSAVLS